MSTIAGGGAMAGRYPFTAIPTGWYVIAASEELRPGDVLARHYFGRDLVLFRTASGRLVMADATCPHMGAHLGSGRVEGETLRCPFHGFQFDPDGSCVATPYGRGVPNRARLRTWHLREHAGLALAWWDPNDKPPEWGVPELDLTGFGSLVCRRYQVASHPQETTENSIDYGHFTSVHRFAHAETTRPVTTDGPCLRSGYAIDAMLGGLHPKLKVRADFQVEVWGLGYSLVHLSVAALRLRARLFVLPVPVDGEHIDLRLACMAMHSVPALGWLFGRFVHRVFCSEVEEDIPIWRQKVYLERPALAPGDGPVAEYRRWASQFYPEATPAGDRSA